MTNETRVMTNVKNNFCIQVMAESSSASGSGSHETDGYDPTDLYDFFDPVLFTPIVSWEHETVNVLRAERNSEELEWLVRLMTICEPYPVEGLVPMDCAHPFRQSDYEDYVAYLIDPDKDLYEYDGRYYTGPDACYGFRDSDFIYLDDYHGPLPLDLWLTFFPPEVPAPADA